MCMSPGTQATTNPLMSMSTCLSCHRVVYSILISCLIITNVYEHMFILSSCSVLNLNQLSINTNVYEHMFILSSCSVLNRLDV